MRVIIIIEKNQKKPPTIEKSSKLFTKIKSSSAPTCPFDYARVIMIKRCPILRSVLHRIIVYFWIKTVNPVTWREGFFVFIDKKGTSKEPFNFRASLYKSFYIAYSKSNVQLSCK